MRSIFAFLIIIVLSMGTGKSQIAVNWHYYVGSYIDVNGDEVSGQIGVPKRLLRNEVNFDFLQMWHAQFKDENGETFYLNKKNCQRYTFVYSETEIINMVKTKNIYSMIPGDFSWFQQAVEEGRGNLFRSYKIIRVGSINFISFRYFIEKEGVYTKLKKGSSSLVKLAELFNDYPELVNEINSGKYRSEELAIIVKKYNDYKL